jgi:hypothetical protein
LISLTSPDPEASIFAKYSPSPIFWHEIGAAGKDSLGDLLKNHRVKPHQTSHEKLHDLRAVVERDLKDVALDQLSADRRFATAYNCCPVRFPIHYTTTE